MSTSPELTGGAGFAFEDAVAASYLVALLAERRARGLREGNPSQVSLQRAALGRPLDDIVITADTPDGAVMLDLQVKRSFSFSAADSNTDFFQIVDRAQKTLSQPTFRLGLDRVGVATDDIKVGDQRQISTLCEWARDSASAADFIARIATPKLASAAQRKTVEALSAGLTRALGRAPTDEEVHGFLRHFVLLRFEIMGEGASDLVWILDRLEGCLANSDATTAEDVWGAIRTIARDASGRAGSFDRQGLLERLGRSGRFSPAASLASDLKRLNDEARLAASTIEHSIDGVVLSREGLVEQVRSELDNSQLVQLVGQPGSGKSALLRTLAEAGDGPRILLRADRLPQGGWPAYAQRLGLTTSIPLPLLREMSAGGEPILFIDGLDRVAKSEQALIVELVDLILDDPGLSRWKIVASLRDGGWQRVRRWLPAVRRAATGSVKVPNLDDEEARSVAAQRPRLTGLLFGTAGVREMARRPFFLNVLASAIDLDAGTPSSETELLAAWWAGGGYDAEGAQRARRQGLLVSLARASATNLGRSGRVSQLDPEAVESLKADAILQDAEPGHTVSFSHDIFFEWSFTHVLIDAADTWMTELVAAGEPPALGRPVELLSQLRFERDQSWEKEFDRLEHGSARTQWRRCWLVAPLSSPLFEAHVATFTQAVSRGPGHRRLEQLLLWFQAVRTEPDNRYWTQALGNLSEADRTRLAMALAVPSDYGAWRRFLTWIVGEQDRLPPRLWSAVLVGVEVWQTAAAQISNDTSEQLLLMVQTWLHALEDDDRFKRRQNPQSRFVDLPYDDDKPLRLELRTLLLRGAVAHPEPTQRYLRRLTDRSDLAHEAFEAILSSAAWAARVAPAILVDLILATALEQLPKAHQEQERREDEAARAKALSYPEGSRERTLLMPSGLGGWINSWDWDHLAIERMSSHFHPPSPIREPFQALFREDPDEALRLIKGLANHAAAAWRELHDLDFQRGRTPRALDLEFPWGRQVFWGAEREYFAYRAAFAPQILEAGLMVLEDWAFGQLEAGADLDDLICRIVEGCTHNAILGVASALILTRPRATWTTLPFASSQRLWRWDLARCVRIERGAPANEIGAFGRPGDLAALKRANGRPARSRWIGNMAPVFMVADDLDLRRAFIQRVSAFEGDPAHDFDEEKEDEAVLADQLRTAAKWAKAASADSYAVTETPEGALIETKPLPPADEVEEQQVENYTQTTRWMALAMWGEAKLGDARDKSALSDAEALVEARALDAPDLFSAVRMLGDLEDIRRAGVVAAAVVVLVEPQYQDAELIGWAEDVLIRALRTPLEEDEFLAPESILPFHPLKYIGQGLAGLVRRGRLTQGATHALVNLASCFVHGIATAAARAAYGLVDVAPRLTLAILQLAVALSIRPDTPLQRWRDRKAAHAIQQAHARASFDQALLVSDGRAEFSLPDLPPDDGEGEHGEAYRDEPWLDTDLLEAHLVAMAGALFSGPVADHVIALGEALLGWTIARTLPGPGRRRGASRLITWRATLMTWLATLARTMDVEVVLEKWIAPVTALEDEICLEFLQPFISRLAAQGVHDAQIVEPATLQIMSQAARRVAALESGSCGRYGAEVSEMLQDLLCVPSHRAGLAVRFANGDWRDLGMVLPIVEILFEPLAARPDFARMWLRLVEAAIEHYPLALFAREARMTVERLEREVLGQEAVAGRISALVQVFVEREGELDPVTRDNLLRVLDRLVDAGDRRSAALQRSDLFRSALRDGEAAPASPPCLDDRVEA